MNEWYKQIREYRDLDKVGKRDKDLKELNNCEQIKLKQRRSEANKKNK